MSAKYVEEREFTLKLALRCEFPDDYEGDEDGFVWHESFAPIAAEIVQAAANAIRRRPGWSVRPANRGRPAEEEAMLIVERTPK
jgi:hypothetical protein